ncbi:MAG TPA: formate dehydrogenase accessory sulfurtransferase FdhD [Acidimicrobiales bacterium]|nr:formate dehydrogenase accessory sulfurtransferase FdhD [Acidimicrobiales bacterium]
MPGSGRTVASRPIVRVEGDARRTRHDVVAGEEPMELRVDGQPVSVTMRTPGHDFELALGFCLTEGLVDAADDVRQIGYCGAAGAGDYNVVDVVRWVPGALDERLRRNVYTTSSCGVCGTTSIDLVAKRCPSRAGDDVRVPARVLSVLPDRLRAEQRLFDRTGGLHAAAVASSAGDLLCLREDVGRHNAVDKVVGWAAMGKRLPLAGHVLVVSGRVAFEIVQKAAVAGAPVLAAVSAPTSLAVDLAAALGITLVGFVRDDTMNVYTGSERVV